MNAKMKAILNVVIVAVVSVALLFGMSAITDTLVKRQEDEAAKIAFGDILNADRLEAIATKDTEGITSAYKALDKNGALIGYAVTATVKGYGGDMAVHVALTPDGSEFIGLRVGSHMETEGYGSKAAEAAYTDRFAGLKAPVSLNGYTGIDEAGQTAARLKDGSYRAEEETYDNGYRYFVELTVAEGRISAVNWDALKEGGDLTKKQETSRIDFTGELIVDMTVSGGDQNLYVLTDKKFYEISLSAATVLNTYDFSAQGLWSYHFDEGIFTLVTGNYVEERSLNVVRLTPGFAEPRYAVCTDHFIDVRSDDQHTYVLTDNELHVYNAQMQPEAVYDTPDASSLELIGDDVYYLTGSSLEKLSHRQQKEE